MNVLITGSAGFIGEVLAQESALAGHRVLGVDVKEPGQVPAGTQFEVCDARDAARVAQLVSAFRPDRIFHLAAQSYPTVSMTKPWETMEINAAGTIHLFEACRTAGLNPVAVVACSSAEYGLVAAADLPVKEDHALRPLHPYGVSKVAQDLLTYQYFANYGIPGIRIRIFNTTGPGKVGDVCSDLTRRAAEIELGLRPPRMPVGNTHTRRALLDVRDLVRGLRLAAERGESGEVYNIGGSRTYTVQEVIEHIQALCGRPFEVVTDPELVRPCDELVIWGDTSRFSKATGWSPEVNVADTVKDMLNWWRRKVAAQVEAAR